MPSEGWVVARTSSISIADALNSETHSHPVEGMVPASTKLDTAVRQLAQQLNIRLEIVERRLRLEAVVHFLNVDKLAPIVWTDSVEEVFVDCARGSVAWRERAAYYRACSVEVA